MECDKTHYEEVLTPYEREVLNGLDRMEKKLDIIIEDIKQINNMFSVKKQLWLSRLYSLTLKRLNLFEKRRR